MKCRHVLKHGWAELANRNTLYDRYCFSNFRMSHLFGINDIPPEVLQHCLGFLSQNTILQKTSLVCRKWYSASNLAIESLLLFRSTPLNSIQKFTYLDSLKVSCKNLNDDALCVYLTAAYISKLDVFNCESLSCPTFKSASLTELVIRNCKQLQTPSLMSQKLTSLNISHCSGFSNEVIQDAVLMNLMLKTLVLNNLKALTSLTIISKSLTNLSVTHCVNLSKLVIDTPNLTILDVSFTKIDDVVVAQLELPKIQLIRMNGCCQLKQPKIFNHSIQVISFDHCKNLTFANISSKSLVELRLSYTRIKDQGLNMILASCPKLSHIQLQKCTLLSNPRLVSDTMESINLHGSHNIEEPSIQSPMLKTLNLNWTQIKDHHVERILEQNPNLSSLEMKVCDQLKSPNVKSDQLERLGLQGKNLLSPIIKCTKLLHFDQNFDCEQTPTSPIVRQLFF